MDAVAWLGLIAVGVGIGAYAGAIGAGGGFLLAPVLLLRYPEASPAEITTATLTVVLVAAVAFAFAGVRGRQLDRPLAALLVAAALPAVIAGAAATALLPRTLFALGFGLLLLAVGVYLGWRPTATMLDPVRGGWRRELVDGEGNVFVYHLAVRRGVAATAAAAFLSTLAGIGGGLIYTPLATRVLRVPHALAVPLAQTLLAGVALVGVLFHLGAGHAADPMADAPPLALGVVVATPLGRALNRRLGEGLLTRALAVGLIAIGVRTALIVL
jgi:uncharacterized membrane protein YfcA